MIDLKIEDLPPQKAESFLNFCFKEALKESGLRAFPFSAQSQCRFILEPATQEPLSCLLFRKLEPHLKEIDFIATRSEYLGRGLASQLIKSLGSESEIWLELSEKNKKAHAFYLSQGFKETALRKNYYSDGSAAILMHKESFTAPDST